MTRQSDFSLHFRSIQRAMRDKAATSSPLFKQMGDRGLHREGILRAFLKEYLPTRFGVGTGEIRDESGTASGQHDVVIFDALNSPLLVSQEGVQIFPVESVFAVIEVRSQIRSCDELRQTRDQIRAAKRPQKREVSVRALPGVDGLARAVGDPLIGCVFAYDGMEGNALVRSMEELRAEGEPGIDLACILGTGTALYERDGVLVYRFGTDLPVVLPWEGKDALAGMYGILMNYLRGTFPLPPTIESYLGFRTA